MGMRWAVALLTTLISCVISYAQDAPNTQAWSAPTLHQSDQWRPLREPRFERGYPWELKDGYLVNTVPPGTPYEAVKRMEKGMGLSLYGFEQPLPLAGELTGTFRVDEAAAAGFVLNAGLEGDALTSHYLVLLWNRGINLWKFVYTGTGENKGDYLKLGWLNRPLEPGTDYELAVTTHFSASANRGHGLELSVSLNGEHVLGVTDPAPLPPGVAGVWLGEGFAGVKQLKLKTSR